MRSRRENEEMRRVMSKARSLLDAADRAHTDAWIRRNKRIARVVETLYDADISPLYFACWYCLESGDSMLVDWLFKPPDDLSYMRKEAKHWVRAHAGGSAPQAMLREESSEAEEEADDEDDDDAPPVNGDLFQERAPAAAEEDDEEEDEDAGNEDATAHSSDVLAAIGASLPPDDELEELAALDDDALLRRAGAYGYRSDD